MQSKRMYVARQAIPQRHSWKYKQILFFLLFLCSFVSTAQYATKGDSLRRYYQLVHKAEHRLLNRQYEDAVHNYDTAFLYLRNPFAVDIQNKLVGNLSLKSYADALLDCYALIKKGATLAYFTQSLFTDFNRSKEGKLLREHYADMHRKYAATIDKTIVASVNKMVDADQSVHCALPSKGRDTSFVRRMHEHDDSLAIILNDMLLRNDYLNEERIGANFKQDTVLLAEPLYGVVALHQIQKGGVALNTTIMKAIQSGQLRAEIGLSWMSQSASAPINLTRIYQIYADTLWKRHETDWEQRMFWRYSGQSYEGVRRILHDCYLDDLYFDVEERVVYNFYKQCSSCSVPISRSICLLPAATTITSFAPEHSAQMIAQLHLNYTPLAFPAPFPNTKK